MGDVLHTDELKVDKFKAKLDIMGEGVRNITDAIMSQGENLAKSVVEGNEYTSEATTALGFSFLGPLYPVLQSLKDLGPIRWGIDKIKEHTQGAWDAAKRTVSKWTGRAGGLLMSLFKKSGDDSEQQADEAKEESRKGFSGIFWALLALPALLWSKFSKVLSGIKYGLLAALAGLKYLLSGKWITALGKGVKSVGLGIGRAAQGAYAMALMGLKGIGKVGKVAGVGALAVGTAALVANDIYQLIKALKENSLAQFSSWSPGARKEFGEHLGGAVGAGTGATLGAIFGGPYGAVIGAAVGKIAGTHIGGFLGAMWPSIVSIAKAAWNHIKIFAFTIWDQIRNLWAGVKDLVYEYIIAPFEGLWDFFDKYLIGPLRSFYEMAIKPLIDAISPFVEKIIGVFKPIIDGVIAAFDKVRSVLVNFILMIGEMLAKIPFVKWGKEAYASIKDWASEFDKAHGISKNYGDYVKETRKDFKERPWETALGAKGAPEVAKKLIEKVRPGERAVEPAPRPYEGRPLPKETGLLHEAQKAQTKETIAVKEEVKKGNSLLKKIVDKPIAGASPSAVPEGISELNLVQ